MLRACEAGCASALFVRWRQAAVPCLCLLILATPRRVVRLRSASQAWSCPLPPPPTHPTPPTHTPDNSPTRT